MSTPTSPYLSRSPLASSSNIPQTESKIVELVDEIKKANDIMHKEFMELFKSVRGTEATTSSSTTQPTNAHLYVNQTEFLIESLSKNISEFDYNEEEGLTFELWFRRYEVTFSRDATNLDDAAKVRLLLRSLNPVVHGKYLNYLLPKAPKEYNFEETVKRLKDLFGRRNSIFNIRYKCFQSTKSETTDFISYMGQVNKACEEFDLNKLTLDQFKCLIFVSGLKSSSDADIRTRILNKLDLDTENKLDLQKLLEECLRIINLKRDTKMIENSQNPNQLEVSSLNKISYKQNATQSSQGKSKGKKVEQNKSKTPYCPCYLCGEIHWVADCPFKTHKCTIYNDIGHKNGYCAFAKCRKFNRRRSFESNKNSKVSTISIKKIESSSKRRTFVTCQVNNKDIKLQFDTGADISLISKQNFEKLGLRLNPTSLNATVANGSSLNLIGEFTANFTFKNKTILRKCYVSNKHLNIFGSDLIDAFDLWDKPINEVCTRVLAIKQTDYVQMLKNKFPTVLDGQLGHCTKMKAHLALRENFKPIFIRCRRPAFGLEDRIEKELVRLKNMGVISPITHSDWAAPIVVKQKPNNQIRICADFSTGLNNELEDYKYPLPLPEDLFTKFSDAKVFSQIDFSDAFFQIEVDDDSKKLLVINTHVGLFRYNRLNFGVKTAPTIFQQFMDQLVERLPGVGAYIDDLFVVGKTVEEHDNNLMKLFERIKEFGFKIKLEKSKFGLNKIKYLGHFVTENCIRPDSERIESLVSMPHPTNISELRSFLCAINFYSKFIDKMRELRGPLDELLKANTVFKWNKKCQKS